MTQIINPKTLRNKDALKAIPAVPGYYKWWVTDATARKILGNFYDELFPKMTSGTGELSGYKYIYVGIASKSLRERLNWHINQKNVESAVKSGFLSTLRQSISSLVCGDQSDTDSTNEIIYEMIVQYFPDDNFAVIEHAEMSAHLLPLNIHAQPNDILKNGFTKHLKLARKEGKLCRK